MARVKDVIDDEEWKMKPLSLLLATGAAILGGMIIFNAVFHQPPRLRVAQTTGATHGDAAPNPDGTTTITLKYDPLIEDAQRELLAIGLFKGQINGVNGQRTRQAILTYQQMNGMPTTGEPSEELINHLRFTHKVQSAAQFTGSNPPAQNLAAVAAPKTALAPVPNPASQAAAQAAQNQRIKKVQVALAGLGYDINTLDGQVNPETRAAILKYQMDNGLDMNGAVDQGLLGALKISGN